MKLLKNTLIFIFLFSMGIFNSCNYLDVNDYFEETLKYDSIFQSKRNIEKYMWGAAYSFPDEGNIYVNGYTPGPFATDEGFTLLSTTNGIKYSLGQVTTTNLQGMDIWNTMYQIVRKSNTIFKRIDEADDLTKPEREQILGYAYFIRAYAYYNLLMQYGPFVMMGDDVLASNEEPVFYDRSRATYDECVDYICQELEEAASRIPSNIAISLFGRPTRDAAYGLIARLRLQQASPLFNGQTSAKTYFGSWKRTGDGVNYISQVYDEEKWAVAAYASKRIIDLGTYKLHTVAKTSDTPDLPSNVSQLDFPYGAGDIDPYRSYADMFTGEAVIVRNPEFVWGRYSSYVLGATRYSFDQAIMGGYNTFGVTQKVIDTYRMADGRSIDNSSDGYPYQTTGTIGSNKEFSGYRLNGTASNMYNNREMRFYASIGFSECYWPANSTTDKTKNSQTITYYASGGTSGKTSVTNNDAYYPITGYVIKKFIHPDDAWTGEGAQRLSKAFPIIRYAEILLSYVEAINNLTATHNVVDADGITHTFSRNTDEIKFYFNQVRFRAGLPGLTDEEVTSAETVNELIKKERMVEFLFENRRYYDVRRWGIYQTVENEPIMGMNTDAAKDGYYTEVSVNSSIARNRIVSRKMVFLPISLTEIRKTTLLDQNPGWE